MFLKPFYLITLLGGLTTAQEIPAGVSSTLGGINPSAYSSAASVLSASSASVASAAATSTGGASAHEVNYAALLGVGGAALNAFM